MGRESRGVAAVAVKELVCCGSGVVAAVALKELACGGSRVIAGVALRWRYLIGANGKRLDGCAVGQARSIVS